jgi:hypothetical protein
LALTINTRPVANAGSNQTVVLPTTSTTLPGSGTDANGDAITYLWTLSSGPTATLTNSTTSSLSLSDLVFGTYVFSLVVNDGIEASAPSYVTIYITYPPNNYSFVRESTIKVAGVTQEIAVAGLTFDQKSENITYYDGIGRPMQAVATQASPAWHDMVSPVVYDAFGREDRKYLPFVAAENTGFYKPAVIDPSTGVYQNAALNFYNGSYAIANDAAPYALSVFEPSPLNRITEQGAPGVAFQPGTNHTIKVSHQTNQTSEVLLFTHDQGTGLILLAPGRYYDPGALYANKTTDEHGNDVIQYIDKEGRTVCKKVQYKTDTDGVTKKYASTYYLFDDLGNLVVVLPPEGEKAIAPTEN